MNFFKKLFGKKDVANNTYATRQTTRRADAVQSGERVRERPSHSWGGSLQDGSLMGPQKMPSRSHPVFALGKEGEPLPLAPENAKPVSKVDDEYALLYLSVCVCGWMGKLKTCSQALTFHENKPMDKITAQCQECGREYSLYFDLSNVKTPNGHTMGESLGGSSDLTEQFGIDKQLKRRSDDTF